MEKIRLVIIGLILLTGFQLHAQKKQVMIITTIEYAEFLSGGNSKMFITYPDGNQEEIEMKGLFAIAGYISEKNIKRNDKTVVDKINEFLNAGWEFENVSLAIRDGSKGESIIFTRYILVKTISN